MTNPNWVFQHGWGFDDSFWESWLPHLSPDSSVQLLNRGYFGKACSFTPSNIPCHVVAHSFGLHLLSSTLLQSAEKLVIIGGFCSFAANERQKTYLLWLKKMLQQNPKRALQQFYRDCGMKQTEEKVPENLSLLKEDLQKIQNLNLDVDALLQVPKIFILHGKKDRISPFERGEELHRLLPNANLFLYSEGSHVLPHTHPKWCLDCINNWR